MSANILEGLNPKQREAVLYFDSPLLIIAGAGSGKTKVITHKIAYLIEKRKCAARSILAVTFTNKAANEMKERVQALTRIDAKRFHISTFHSLGLKILRESGRALGFDGDWQVVDDWEQKRILARIAKESSDHLARDMDDNLVKKINLAKMNLLYANNPDYLLHKGFSSSEVNIYSRYYDFQKKNKLWDYEDLISLPVKLLQAYEEIGAKYRDRFKYVLIDEFQDTNPNQYELVKIIARDNKGITAVGDDDQAIYSWRGASMRFLFDFEHDFPGANIIKLEQNYRSTQPVLDFANSLIDKNFLRRKKSMWTEKWGKPVFVLDTISKEDEAEKTALLILELKQTNPQLFPLAILYRINSQSLAFETELLKRGIDFKILRGQPFFERKEIRDSLALLRLALNPTDDNSFLRMIDFLPLGIGEKTAAELAKIAERENLPLLSALKEFMPGQFQGKKIFARLLELNRQAAGQRFAEILDTLLKESGYLESLENRDQEDRLFNVRELTGFIDRWQAENPAAGITELLDSIHLDKEGKEKDEAASVYLLTMHNAKGLEFPTVIAAGVNSTYVPFFKQKEREAIEEERRLFYVAATRASKQLIVSQGSQNPSPFLADIKSHLYTTAYSIESLIAHLAPAAGGREAGENRARPGAAGAAAPIMEERFVHHPIFGRGKIVKALGDKKYLIHFANRGEKAIDTSIVSIEFL